MYFQDFSLRPFMTFSWRRYLLYRNQTIDFLSNLMDWFQDNRDLRDEILKRFTNGAMTTSFR